jgi:hypothetical protein
MVVEVTRAIFYSCTHLLRPVHGAPLIFGLVVVTVGPAPEKGQRVRVEDSSRRERSKKILNPTH